MKIFCFVQEYQNSFPTESSIPKYIAQLYASKLFADLKFYVCGSVHLKEQHGSQQNTIIQKQEEDECMASCSKNDDTRRMTTMIEAHSVVVCVRSAWFRRALNSGMKEAQEMYE